MIKAAEILFPLLPLYQATPQSLEVEKGKTYNYYAYSYNKEALADVTAVPSAIDKDLLYTSGEVTILKVKPQGELETVPLPLPSDI
jgi:NADPH-dependent 7-cyano-7-deazaguanine reductase QueF-like protein